MTTAIRMMTETAARALAMSSHFGRRLPVVHGISALVFRPAAPEFSDCKGRELSDGVDVELKACEDAEHDGGQRHENQDISSLGVQVENQAVLLILSDAESEYPKYRDARVEEEAEPRTHQGHVGHLLDRGHGFQFA